ncbi:MAG: hypothetical protein AAB225_08930 [Acidobacteriota bacterium]
MPVIPVVFRGLALGEIGHPLSPKHGRDLGNERRVAALLDDVAGTTKATPIWRPSEDDLQEFVGTVRAAEKKLPHTEVCLLPRVSRKYKVLELRFRLLNAGTDTIEPTRPTFEILASLPAELRALLLRYRVYAENVSLPEGELSYEQISSTGE